MVIKKKRPSILSNGHLSRPVVIGSKRVTLENTCSLDSLVHMFASACVVSHPFEHYIHENSSVDFARLVSHVAKQGVDEKAYSLRAALLVNHFGKKSKKKEICIDAKNTAMGMLEKLWNLTTTERCDFCRGRSKSSKVQQISADMAQFEKSLSDNANEICKCDFIVKVENQSTFLLIETFDSTSECLEYESKLMDVPTRLDYSEKIYNLRGVIGYEAEHFVAYCRGEDQRWTIYNDLNRSARICDSTNFISAQVLLYTV